MKKFFNSLADVRDDSCCRLGNKQVIETNAILPKESFWVADSENMQYLNDAIARKDAEYMKQLILERKVFFVDKDTKIACFGMTADKSNVLIRFKEGRYTNKTG